MASTVNAVRIRVSRSALIERIRDEKKRIELANASSEKEDRERLAKWKRDAREAINATDFDCYPRIDSAPHRRITDTAQHEADIRLLEMSNDDEIVMSRTSDLFRYLK